MATSARLTLDTSTPQAAMGTDVGPVAGGTVVLTAQGAGTIVMGGSAVTTGTGARKTVAVGDTLTFVIPAGDDIYLLCSAATLAVDVLRFG